MVVAADAGIQMWNLVCLFIGAHAGPVTRARPQAARSKRYPTQAGDEQANQIRHVRAAAATPDHQLGAGLQRLRRVGRDGRLRRRGARRVACHSHPSPECSAPGRRLRGIGEGPYSGE
jgi:hypothetical protein